MDNFNLATLQNIHLLGVGINLVEKRSSLVLSELHVENPLVLDVLWEALEEVDLIQRDFQKDFQGVVINHDVLFNQIVQVWVDLK